jgi:hypothetical protein
MAGSLTAIALGVAFIAAVQPPLDTGQAAPVSKKKVRTVKNAPVATYVPSDLKPSLSTAKDDLPRVYEEKCHVRFSPTISPRCVYGAEESDKTMVLYGDSLAAQWFPAFEKIALAHGWRLVSLTKSACPSVEVRINLLDKGDYTECYPWRVNSIERIASLEADLVIVANSRSYGVTTDVWASGLNDLLESLPTSTERLVLSDTPRSKVDGPICLSAHLKDPEECATPKREAIDQENVRAEARATRAAGADFLRTSPWICPRDPCPMIAWDLLIMRDVYHLTATFAEFLVPQLERALVRLGYFPAAKAHG